MTREQLIAWGLANGMVQDARGHLKYERRGSTYRLHMGPRSVRLQVWHPGIHEWIPLYSQFYSKLSINEKNQLAGLRKWGG
jgi:hypothetical protein